ncbi:type IV pilus assembly protein PilM [bacterium]|nr:type IV pilus assembly protein PilM [bacterium]
MRKTEQHRGLVGVDIGSTSVKLVELSGSPQAFELENISVVAVPDDASSSAYGKAMALVLDGKDLVTNRTAISVSGRKVAVRGMRFPALGKAELDGALRYEGSQVIAFELHDSYLDHCVIESDRTSPLMDVLFVAARKETVDAKIAVLEEAGLEPRVVGVDALVLLDALLLEEELPETCGVIDVGALSTSIGIARKGTVPFVRDIEIGGNNYTEAIANALSLSLEDAEKAKIMEPERELACARAIEHVTRQLVGELSRSLMYYQSRPNSTQVDALFMCGGASIVPGLGDAISEMAGLQVVSWSPLDRVHVDDTRFDAEAVKRLAPISSLAAALAMKKDPN